MNDKYYIERGVDEQGIECPRNVNREEGVPFWNGPEVVHYVENPEGYPLEAVRVELKS